MKKIVISEPHLPELDEVLASISEIWASKWLTNDGPKLREFEDRLQAYLGINYLAVLNNGHNSLEVGLRSLEIQGEVITTPYSFVSTSQAIRNVGAEVVFADIEKGGVNIDPLQVEKLITDRTSAILAVHTYGVPCDIAALTKISEKYGLKLIFDGAHAFGVSLDSRPISSFGDMTMFSFHATKLFHCIEGGALVVRDQQVLERVRRIRNFGITGPDDIAGEGTNAKLNEVLASIGLLNLNQVDIEIDRRTKLASLYWECLADVPGLSRLEIPDAVSWNYAYYPVFFDQGSLGIDPRQMEKELIKEDIIGRRYFSVPITSIDTYRNCKGSSKCANSDKLAQQVLCLPLHARMIEQDVLFVCDVFKKAIAIT